jgi:hypothetical protein
MRLNEDTKHAFHTHRTTEPVPLDPPTATNKNNPNDIPHIPALQEPPVIELPRPPAVLNEVSGAPAGPSGHTSESWLPPIKRDKSTSIRFEGLDCAHSSLVSYWREETEQDKKYVSPFSVTTNSQKYFKGNKLTTKYITFEPDAGGWNNIRMQMEIILVLAAATGRTLVIPPDQAMVIYA